MPTNLICDTVLLVVAPTYNEEDDSDEEDDSGEFYERSASTFFWLHRASYLPYYS